MSGSYFTMNQKYNSLLALINGFFPFPPSPYPPPGDVMTLSTAQTASGLKTFSVLPQSSVVPLANNDLVNKLYVDGAVGATPDLQTVLTAGNDSILDIVLKDTLVAPISTNTIADTSITLSNFTAGQNDSEILIEDTSTTSEVRVAFDDLAGTVSSVASIKSQFNQTDYSTSVFDTPNSLTGTKTLITIGGAILDTDTASDGIAGSTAIRNATTTSGGGVQTGSQFQAGGQVTTFTTNASASNAQTELTFLDANLDIKSRTQTQLGQTDLTATAENLATGQNCSRTNITAPTALVDNHISSSDASVAPAKQVSYSTQINQTNSLVGQDYRDNGVSQIVNTIRNIVTATTTEDELIFSDAQFLITATTNAEAGIGRRILTASSFQPNTGNVTATESVGTNSYDVNVVANNDPSPTTIATKVESVGAGTGYLTGGNYTNNTSGSFTQFQTECNAGTSSTFYGASDTINLRSQFLRLECPVLGDTLIEHTALGSISRNLVVQTTGDLRLTSDTLNSTATNLSMTSTGTGGLANPTLTLTNSNATINTIPTIEFNKTGRNLTAGESIGSISMYGLDAGGQKTEFSRIQVKTENVASGNEDGTLSIFNAVNGASLEVFNFNGGQNENNTFRPLDMNGNALRSNVGNLVLEASASIGTGAVSIATKNGTPGSGGGLLLTGDTLLSASAGGGSGQHLCLTIGGTVYKIALLNA